MIYTIFAGVNGVGKSTIYYLLTEEEKRKLGKRINVDELVSSIGNWKDELLQIKASKQIVKDIKNCISNHLSFNQETTLAGKSILSTIKKAKQEGYKINLNYVYVANVEIAKKRVLERVKNSGHGVPAELIEQRFPRSLENLKIIIPLCDEVNIFDNTITFYQVANIKKNKVTILTKNIPDFMLDILTK